MRNNEDLVNRIKDKKLALEHQLTEINNLILELDCLEAEKIRLGVPARYSRENNNSVRTAYKAFKAASALVAKSVTPQAAKTDQALTESASETD